MECFYLKHNILRWLPRALLLKDSITLEPEKGRGVERAPADILELQRRGLLCNSKKA
jgi:hypothetical protein